MILCNDEVDIIFSPINVSVFTIFIKPTTSNIEQDFSVLCLNVLSSPYRIG